MRYQFIIFLVFFFSEAKSQATIFSNYLELNDQFDQVKVVMLGEIHHNDQKSMIEMLITDIELENPKNQQTE